MQVWQSSCGRGTAKKGRAEGRQDVAKNHRVCGKCKRSGKGCDKQGRATGRGGNGRWVPKALWAQRRSLRPPAAVRLTSQSRRSHPAGQPAPGWRWPAGWRPWSSCTCTFSQRNLPMSAKQPAQWVCRQGVGQAHVRWRSNTDWCTVGVFTCL